MKQNQAIAMIGLANRAGKIVSGETAVEKAVKKGNAYLCILAEDASDRSKKSYADMCDYYETKLCVYGTKETLGHILGKEIRAALAVTDESLAETIVRKMDDNTEA